jgi:hypothetical protein
VTFRTGSKVNGQQPSAVTDEKSVRDSSKGGSQEKLVCKKLS